MNIGQNLTQKSDEQKYWYIGEDAGAADLCLYLNAFVLPEQLHHSCLSYTSVGSCAMSCGCNNIPIERLCDSFFFIAGI